MRKEIRRGQVLLEIQSLEKKQEMRRKRKKSQREVRNRAGVKGWFEDETADCGGVGRRRGEKKREHGVPESFQSWHHSQQRGKTPKVENTI